MTRDQLSERLEAQYDIILKTVQESNDSHNGNKIEVHGFGGGDHIHAMLTLSSSEYHVEVFINEWDIEIYTTHDRDDHDERSNEKVIKTLKPLKTYINRYL